MASKVGPIMGSLNWDWREGTSIKRYVAKTIGSFIFFIILALYISLNYDIKFALGFIAVFFLNAGYMPQIYRIWKSGKARDIDLMRYHTATIAMVLISVYAMKESGDPLYILSSLWGIANLTLVTVGKVRGEVLYAKKVENSKKLVVDGETYTRVGS